MKPYYQDKAIIYLGDCREILPSLAGFSAVVTDPPYELGFMGKSWDSQGVSFQKETWEIIRKSCLSGSPLLSFGGSRTQHRIACAIEDAGWEIRDTLMWVYGSGFPKSLDISKAIDRTRNDDIRHVCRWLRAEMERANLTANHIAEHFNFHPRMVEHWAAHDTDSQPTVATWEQWVELKMLLGFSGEMDTEVWRLNGRKGKPGDNWDKREVIGHSTNKIHLENLGQAGYKEQFDLTSPATPEAQLWSGYGTALKPAYEPIILAMNPLDGTFANNALKHKVAGLNIDGCRIDYQSEKDKEVAHYNALGMERLAKDYGEKLGSFDGGWKKHHPEMPKGRFPANFLHDGSQMVMELFPNSKGMASQVDTKDTPSRYFGADKHVGFRYGRGDNGSAARFFYCAKASKAERDRGCEELEAKQMDESRKEGNPGGDNPRNRGVHKVHNNHPTVKPLALMEYLCKLVKMPEYNLILDPFCGSGTTLLACIKLGIPCIGIDSDEQACEIAARRCSQGVMDFSEVSKKGT
jgi:hypothetical protein